MFSLTVKIYTMEILEGSENFLPLEYILTFLLFMNAYLIIFKNALTYFPRENRPIDKNKHRR